MLSESLTIFEGPDGAGKSTAARQYAELTGALYVHFPALPKVGKNLARMYVEAMMPALLGHQPVVFDRCWLSEFPYGVAFRKGVDRLGGSSRRMLERLAMRCGAVVIFCDPGWKTVETNYGRRRELELLKSYEQLKIVHELYRAFDTNLPFVTYDYTTRDVALGLLEEIESLRSTRHHLDYQTAGNLDGKVAIVGKNFAERKDCDPWYQWPFASFDKGDCSQWLAKELTAGKIGEHQLLWLNADMDLGLLHDYPKLKIVALGKTAEAEVYRHKLSAAAFPHPQAWRRFQNSEPYPLIKYLQEVL